MDPTRMPHSAGSDPDLLVRRAPGEVQAETSLDGRLWPRHGPTAS